MQSPLLLAEFDHQNGVFIGNTEPERFHGHLMVRMPNGNDYGKMLLRQHFAQVAAE